jgi:hypothetical protein
MTKVCVMKTTDDERFFKRSRNQPKNTGNWLVFFYEKLKF